jgi:hypothetical protein
MVIKSQSDKSIAFKKITVLVTIIYFLEENGIIIASYLVFPATRLLLLFLLLPFGA